MENEDRLIEFGRRIKEVRTYMKLTQKDVAEKLGITQITVSRMEQGKDVSGRKLMQFLDFYSHYISIDNLFGEKFDLIEEENISLLFDKTSIDVIMKSKLNNSIKKMEEAKKHIEAILDYMK